MMHSNLFAESPRDASNKDSPASQADSGVFSIASSNSPSKERDGGSMGSNGSSGTGASTSPDSPSRIDSMPTSFGDQTFNNSGSNSGMVGMGGGSSSLTRKVQDGQENVASSATNYGNKSSSIQHIGEKSEMEKSSSMVSGEKVAFTKSLSSSSSFSSVMSGASKISGPNVTPKVPFEGGPKHSSQTGGGPRPNACEQHQQRQFHQQQQQLTSHQSSYSNGPMQSPSAGSGNSGSGNDPSNVHPMYRGTAAEQRDFSPTSGL